MCIFFRIPGTARWTFGSIALMEIPGLLQLSSLSEVTTVNMMMMVMMMMMTRTQDPHRERPRRSCFKTFVSENIHSTQKLRILSHVHWTSTKFNGFTKQRPTQPTKTNTATQPYRIRCLARSWFLYIEQTGRGGGCCGGRWYPVVVVVWCGGGGVVVWWWWVILRCWQPAGSRLKGRRQRC